MRSADTDGYPKLTEFVTRDSDYLDERTATSVSSLPRARNSGIVVGPGQPSIDICSRPNNQVMGGETENMVNGELSEAIDTELVTDRESPRRQVSGQSPRPPVE